MKLRFSIRDLLWLAVVVALATAWWMNVVWLQRLERNLSEDALKKTIKTAITEREKELRDAQRAYMLENPPAGTGGGKGAGGGRGKRISETPATPPPPTSR